VFKIPTAEMANITPMYQNYLTKARHILQDGKLQEMTLKQVSDNRFEAEAYFDTHDKMAVTLIIDGQGRILENWTNNPYNFQATSFEIAVVIKINKSSIKKLPYAYENPAYLTYLEQRRIWEEKQRLAEIIRLGEKSIHLIERYKESANEEIEAVVAPRSYRLVVSAQFEQGSLYLKFKVGDKALYSLKRIPAFLNQVDKGEMVAYGKKLAFKHQEQAFTETSQKLIAFMRQAARHNDFYYQNEMDLTLSQMDDFFGLCQSLPLSERDFLVEQGQFLPPLAIHEEENHYRVTVDLPMDAFLGKKHLYRFKNNTLIQTPWDEMGKAADFVREVERSGHLYLPKSHWADFYHYVLSDTKQYFTVDEQFQIGEEDSIKLFGDIDDDGMIRFHMEYVYSDGKVRQAFDPKNSELSVGARKLENYLLAKATVKEGYAYLDPGTDEGIEFVRRGIPYLQQFCQVFISEALKQIGNKRPISFSIGVNLKNDLLAMDIESIDIPKNELAQVLGAYKRKRKFYRLKNGEQLYLDPEGLGEMDALLNSYGVSANDIANGQVEVDMYRAFAIDQRAEGDHQLIQIERSQLFKDMIKRFENVKEHAYSLSEGFDTLLRDYQKTGYKWLRTLGEYGFGGILADDMGLGKTLQAITLLRETKSPKNTSIVICPASLILNWEEEIKKFAPDLSAAVVYGAAPAREALIKDWKKYDVLVTSYDYIRRDIELYKKHKFHIIVLDEAQYIKNPKTKGAQAVKKLKGRHKLALTGTPIENSLAELWSIFDFLMPGYLYNYSYFSKEYEGPIVRDKNAEQQAALKRLISPFILRRTKKEVLTELPDKIENVLPIEFSEEENKLYLANLLQANNELKDMPNGEPINKIAILAMLTRLRQICIEPRLVFEDIDTPSSKLESCVELIKTLRENNKKVLLFSSFTSVFPLLATELATEGISFFTLTGQTDKDKRRDLVNQFQAGRADVFMISLKAGGTGLNLTAAEAVIHFDPWWNVSAQNQATDRAHRMGQKNMVQVFKLVMKNSIEEKIIQLQDMKKHLSDTFVEGNDGTITSMSTDDLMELLHI